MKQYISPVAKSIEISAEACFLTGSKDPENSVFNKVSNNAEMSNKRQSSIWDEE